MGKLPTLPIRKARSQSELCYAHHNWLPNHFWRSRFCFKHTTPAIVSFQEGGIRRAGLIITFVGVNFSWHHLDRGCHVPPIHKVEVNRRQQCHHRGLTSIPAGFSSEYTHLLPFWSSHWALHTIKAEMMSTFLLCPILTQEFGKFVLNRRGMGDIPLGLQMRQQM